MGGWNVVLRCGPHTMWTRGDTLMAGARLTVLATYWIIYSGLLYNIAATFKLGETFYFCLSKKRKNLFLLLTGTQIDIIVFTATRFSL